MKTNKGFTLIELLVVIGIIAILAAIVIVSINPAKRFQDARNSQRQANVEAILGALQQAMVDNKGEIPDDCGITASALEIKSAAGGANLAHADCLGAYLAVLPYDPSHEDAEWVSAANYNTEYTVKMDATTKQITIAAPESENDGYDPNEDDDTDVITVTR